MIKYDTGQWFNIKNKVPGIKEEHWQSNVTVSSRNVFKWNNYTPKLFQKC